MSSRKDTHRPANPDVSLVFCMLSVLVRWFGLGINPFSAWARQKPSTLSHLDPVVGEQNRYTVLNRVADLPVFTDQHGLQRRVGIPLGLSRPQGERPGTALRFQPGQQFRRGRGEPLTALGTAQ